MGVDVGDEFEGCTTEDREELKMRLILAFIDSFGYGPPIWKMETELVIRYLELMLQGETEQAKSLLPDMSQFGPDGEIRAY